MEGSYPMRSEMPSAPPPSFDEAVYGRRIPIYTPQPTVTPAPASYMPQQIITVAPALGPRRAKINCPHCLTYVTTSTESEANFTAHLCCLILLVVGCFPCSCIPYCMDSLKTVQHSCPKCKNFLGSYRP